MADSVSGWLLSLPILGQLAANGWDRQVRVGVATAGGILLAGVLAWPITEFVEYLKGLEHTAEANEQVMRNLVANQTNFVARFERVEERIGGNIEDLDDTVERLRGQLRETTLVLERLDERTRMLRKDLEKARQNN